MINHLIHKSNSPFEGGQGDVQIFNSPFEGGRGMFKNSKIQKLKNSINHNS
jgi:hypothetical protein